MSQSRLSDLRVWKLLQDLCPMLEWAIPALIRNLELSQDRCESRGLTSLDLRKIREFWIYELKKTALTANLSQALPEHVVRRCESEVHRVLGSLQTMVCEESLVAVAQILQESQGRPNQSSVSAFFPYINLGMLTEIHQSYLPDEKKLCVLAESVELKVSMMGTGFEPLDLLKDCNRYLESVFFMSSRSSGTPQTEFGSDETESLGLDTSIAPFVEASLRAIHYDLTHCRDHNNHRFLLQLSGFKAADGPDRSPLLLPFLISNCRPPQLWQEAHVLQSPQKRRRARLVSSRSSVKHLCGLIAAAKCRGEGLKLEVETGPAGSKIFNTSTEQEPAVFSQRAADLSLERALSLGLFQPVSCGQAPGPESRFSVRAKRHLALTVARSFMHLYPSRWARRGWSADQVFFLSPLETDKDTRGPAATPFVPCVAPAGVEDELGDSTGGSTTMVTDILLLGKLLLEIECGQAILPEASADNTEASLFLLLQTVIETLEADTHGYYLTAAEGCLELHRELLSMSPDDRVEHGQRLIYDRVVSQLERDLSLYRRPNLKRRFSGSPEPGLAKRASRRVIESHRDPKSSSVEWPAASSFSNSQLCSNLKAIMAPATFSPPVRSGKAVMIPQIALFDGLGTPTPDSDKVKAARLFFKYHHQFCSRHLDPLPEDAPLRGPSTRRPGNIRICVIDTGLQRDNPVVHVSEIEGRIKDCHSWLDKNDPRNVDDTFGHGTHVAELLIRVAPRADLYIAKVADSDTIPATQIPFITEAIFKASDEWHVDIIVMSFGLRTGWDQNISAAIKHAAQKSIIMFAAAANHGRNEPRTFPATERDVICIHACDGHGGDAGINPQPAEGDLNFSTLGVAVDLIWDSEEVFKSGTSFATPIAAGFAADALEIIARQDILPEPFDSRLFSGEGIRYLFQKMSMEQKSGYRFLAPWILWKHGGYSKERIRCHFGMPETEA